MSRPAVRLILLFLCYSVLAPLKASASVILSEIQIAGAKASDEFIEMYNAGDEPVNLSGWSLRRKSVDDSTLKGSSLKTFGASDQIPAQSYFLWANSSSIYTGIADVMTSAGLSDNNSLALYDESGINRDALTWGTGHIFPFATTTFSNPASGDSFTRDPSTLVWAQAKMVTPTNALGQTYEQKTSPAGSSMSPFHILINEVFPNPKEKGDAGEYVELYNPGETAIDLAGWELRDASITGKYTIPSGTLIAPLSYIVITDQDFSFSLNNSVEILSLFDAEKRLVHQVAYTRTKDGVALNLVRGTLRGARKPTPGTVNNENTDPVTRERVPKNGYKNFALEFRARGKDQNGDTLKYTWNFGDGHKSYKENTTHKYLQSGQYTVTLTTDDGIDTTEETFLVKIQQYTAPILRMVALLPNPAGIDSKLEWIEIENRERSAINLKGFSIATGTKKKSMTNHPIHEDCIIPPRTVKRLTRTESLFTLGNVRSHIELRAPDGKAIQHLSYKFDKSLRDNVLLKKEKGHALVVTDPLPVVPEPISEAMDPSAPETSVPTTADPSVLPADTILDTEILDQNELERELFPTENKDLTDTIPTQKSGWTHMTVYGTPFVWPGSLIRTAEATTTPTLPSGTFTDESDLRSWSDSLNAFLNQLWVRLTRP